MNIFKQFPLSQRKTTLTNVAFIAHVDHLMRAIHYLCLVFFSEKNCFSTVSRKNCGHITSFGEFMIENKKSGARIFAAVLTGKHLENNKIAIEEIMFKTKSFRIFFSLLPFYYTAECASRNLVFERSCFNLNKYIFRYLINWLSAKNLLLF